MRFGSVKKDLYASYDLSESSCKNFWFGIFTFNLFPDSLIKATEPSLIFSKPRYAVEYLSETTSPCSVYLIWDNTVPFGCAEIEL